MSRPRIAICFFGITRSLHYTIGSIERRILRPAARQGETRIFAHFFRQAEIANARSGEFGRLRADEHALLRPDWLELEEPDQCLAQHGFEVLKAHGDPWDDGFVSLRNLVHQLHSLDRVTGAALDWRPDIVIFARPDLRYHEGLAGPLRRIRKATGDVALVPDWQHWRGGLNDRFALCTAPDAAAAYGRRVHRMTAYCEAVNGPLHAELLLRHCLEEAGVTIGTIPTLASRVRFDGSLKREEFCPLGTPRLQRYRTRFRALF